ncbi:bcl-2-binding component 3 [Echinops telfairi]|uniref:Bcl-2-binding component 3 n=1 Tax=Echinops telfairi TaxID=9371 RepID=A0AC55DA22_ECHTE|nr:bcl-2-binding component 3 [Echinops telfairi]
MARARQEGSSPEPVEGLARDSPRPFPLGRLVPSAVSCGLCESGLPAAPALLPAAYLCAPTAPPAVPAALGAPRWPGGPRSRPRGPRPDGGNVELANAGLWILFHNNEVHLIEDGVRSAFQRQEEQQRHRPSPWRVLYNLILGLLPLPRGHGGARGGGGVVPEMEPN